MTTPSQLNYNKRFWEIDFLRGLAIIAMIIFHVVFDLDYFSILKIDTNNLFWTIFRVSIFSLFFLLVGVSLSLSHSKNKKFLDYLKRGLKIFFWGMMITLTTVIFMQQGYVLFGVLHFIGFSIILAYPFLKFSYLNLIFAVPIILVGLYLFNFYFDFQWLLWLGLKPHHFQTVDYFPLLPYFGIILIGIFLGKKLYSNHNRMFKLKDSPKQPIMKFFEFLGKKSLFIYLLHQPIIIAVLLLIKLNLK
ncbi:heparan-alpha-glucosaminide N-acetyltransferase [Patescibacteria group bacterium]